MKELLSQINIDEEAISRGLLRLIASEDSQEERVASILTLAESVVKATAGAVLLFAEPRQAFVAGVEVDQLAGDKVLLTAAVQANGGPVVNNGSLVQGHTGDVLVVPISVTVSEPVGVLLLLVETGFGLDENLKQQLSLLLDGLKIVVREIRADSHHERIGRNHSEFMRAVSHDLRSPLTSIQGFASMLESDMVGELNAQQAHFVEKILSGVSQMTSLVDNIQDSGRFDPETGFYEMQRTHCDLAEIVHRIVQEYLVPAEKQALNLGATIADDVPVLMLDGLMMERAIINLVDNAIKYTPNGGDVDVNLHRVGDQVRISVKDSGLGISPENQAMLFERHFRIPRREHKRIKGSGLGLFIVRSVARRHGGDAWVESEPEGGSTFIIGIPLNEENVTVRQ